MIIIIISAKRCIAIANQPVCPPARQTLAQRVNNVRISCGLLPPDIPGILVFCEMTRNQIFTREYPVHGMSDDSLRHV